MSQVNLLRLLLAAAFLLAIGAGALNTLSIGSLAPEIQAPFRALLDARRDLGTAFLVGSAVYELALLAAIVGMMLRRRWGRMLGLVVTAVTLVQALLLGPHVYTGAAFMLSYASKVAWGAGLATAFWIGDAGAEPA